MLCLTMETICETWVGHTEGDVSYVQVQELIKLMLKMQV